ncbi:MAG: hypothetical protein ACO1OY_07485 [Ramlibacter sp.]
MVVFLGEMGGDDYAIAGEKLGFAALSTSLRIRGPAVPVGWR